MVYPVGKRLAAHHSIDDVARKRPAELPHIGGVDVAVQYARHVVAAVDGDELSADRIAVAMLEENLFADVRGLRTEVHRLVLAVERQAAQSDALHVLFGRHAYGGGIGEDAAAVLPRLLGVVELYASDLCCTFHGEEGLLAVGDDEERACGA